MCGLFFLLVDAGGKDGSFRMSEKGVFKNTSIKLETVTATINIKRPPANKDAIDYTKVTAGVLAAAGFGFCLGTTETNQKLITKVVDNSASSGVLWVGDVVMAINGVGVKDVAHPKCLAMVRAGDAVTFVIKRRIGKFGIVVEPGEAGHGLDLTTTVAGVKHLRGVSKSCPAYGLVRVGDMIASANGADLSAITLEECATALAVRADA